MGSTFEIISECNSFKQNKVKSQQRIVEHQLNDNSN